MSSKASPSAVNAAGKGNRRAPRVSTTSPAVCSAHVGIVLALCKSPNRQHESTMQTEVTLLFLDFDGVLHPKGCGTDDHFSHLPRFERLVREHPGLRIVISSNWQDAYSIKTLRHVFSPDVAQRIIGGTRSADLEGEAEDRHEQIQRYLHKAGVTHVRWLALDDAAHEFPDDCAQLVLCDSARAFDAETAARLSAMLASSAHAA